MVDYIKLFDIIIEFINWDILQDTSFKLNTYNKVSKLFTKDHLKLMIYNQISQKDSLRDLNFGISMSSKLKETVAVFVKHIVV